MNPAVRVAYEKTWYHWHNVVLRRPVIRWWLRKSSPPGPVKELTVQVYGVTTSHTGCLIGHLSISEDEEIIVPGLGSKYPLPIRDVHLYRGRKTDRGTSDDFFYGFSLYSCTHAPSSSDLVREGGLVTIEHDECGRHGSLNNRSKQSQLSLI
jgi:hypothetical protein